MTAVDGTIDSCYYVCLSIIMVREAKLKIRLMAMEIKFSSRHFLLIPRVPMEASPGLVRNIANRYAQVTSIGTLHPSGDRI